MRKTPEEKRLSTTELAAALPDGYEVSTDTARLDVDRVHRWLSTDSYWAMGRSRETQDAAVAGSLNFGVYDTVSGAQVGYARVVSDLATFAWLCDVYIDRSVRGKGFGSALVAVVRDHLESTGVPRILLATGDAHGVYEKIGFHPLESPEEWMILRFSAGQ
ncbi:GNAT family N-acetyltransferase [Nocardia sp. XZ_19_385]|uniref:GNAT family N-acetyltransferase n=1 Tax=Nocardia sp. XZ_19_385 TaxID=2769488 RepID=UPI0028168EA8|nr:GNAT family N-acetyltransferase [Nocardia sp. XZ_19_385]